MNRTAIALEREAQVAVSSAAFIGLISRVMIPMMNLDVFGIPNRLSRRNLPELNRNWHGCAPWLATLLTIKSRQGFSGETGIKQIYKFACTATSSWLRIGVAGVMLAQTALGQARASYAGVVDDAEQLISVNRLEQANELLTDYLLNHPDDDAAKVELGKVQLAQGLNDDAMKSFEAVLRNIPDSNAAREGEVKAATAAALADRKAGSPDYALIDLLRARKVVADSPELLLDIGIQEESMRIYRDADETLTKAHELAPKDLKILYALAHVELDEQKMPEAEANLRAYLKAMPDDATAHYGLGKLLHMELRVDEAKTELSRSIELVPRQSASYYELGEMALEQEQGEDAKSEFQKVLSLAPNHGGALTGMGILSFRAKDYPAAEQYLKSAILNAPDYPSAHHYYALVLSRLGRTEEAKDEAALATKLDEEQTKTSRGNFLKEIY